MPRRPRSPIYCGNNSLDPHVQNGRSRIGTRYECLKKGFGRGVHEPVNKAFDRPYSPIDVRKFYCGNDNVLPDEYHDFGTLHGCFMTGYGAGKKSRASREKKSTKKSSKKSPKESKKSSERLKRSLKKSVRKASKNKKGNNK